MRLWIQSGHDLGEPWGEQNTTMVSIKKLVGKGPDPSRKIQDTLEARQFATTEVGCSFCITFSVWPSVWPNVLCWPACAAPPVLPRLCCPACAAGPH